MNQTRFLQLGWIIAVAMACVLATVGFQTGTEKFGVVNLSKVIDQSDFGKQSAGTLRQMIDTRESLLKFLDDFRIATTEQSSRLRDLWLKGATATDAEKAEIDRIKAEIIAADKRSRELAVKPNLTADDRLLVEEYARRSQTMTDVLNRWLKEFAGDTDNYAAQQRKIGLEKAQEATTEVAKAQACTIVLDSGIAPYGAIDLTPAALTAMNAKK
jgi:Skp family chaperone for outer membrane proteins